MENLIFRWSIPQYTDRMQGKHDFPFPANNELDIYSYMHVIYSERKNNI